MKLPLKRGADDFQTPPAALEPLLPYVPRPWTVWECAQGRGNLVAALAKRGYSVIGSDILTGQNFLWWEPEHYDCIITNPPFSLKQQFLARCYGLGKPFALLLPLTTFETAKRQTLFLEYGVEVIFLPGRVNFETPPGQGSGSWFATAWFTNGLNVGRQLTFPPLTTPLEENRIEEKRIRIE